MPVFSAGKSLEDILDKNHMTSPGLCILSTSSRISELPHRLAAQQPNIMRTNLAIVFVDELEAETSQTLPIDEHDMIRKKR